MLIDTSEHHHKCKLCEETFIQEEELEAHVLAHTGERPYECSECEQSFLLLTDLNKHVLTHEVKRPYECSECERSFTQQKNLKNHMLTHTDSGFKWTKETITLLLESYYRRRHLFKNPQVKKITIWKELMEEFNALGYEISWENLDIKFRNLKKTYMKICNNNKICSGSGPVKWEFFHLFSGIFAEDIHVSIDPNIILQNTDLDEVNQGSDTIEEEETTHDTVWTSEAVKTCKKRKRDESDDKAGPSSVQSDSSTQSSYIYETAERGKSLITQHKTGSAQEKFLKDRKKILKLEEERVLALKNISKYLGESLEVQKEQLKIQRERNRLLTYILEKLN